MKILPKLSLQLWKKLLEGGKETKLNDFDRAVELNDRGCDLLETRVTQNFKEAIQYFYKAIETCPLYPQAYMNLANCLDDLGQRDKAIELYTKALEAYAQLEQALGREFGPDDKNRQAQIYDNMAITYENMGKSNEANECRSKARRLRVIR